MGNLEEMNRKQAELKKLFDLCWFKADDGNWSQEDRFWKREVSVIVKTVNADKFNEALDWFVGGHEDPEPVETSGVETGLVRVRSKGYYHYVGS